MDYRFMKKYGSHYQYKIFYHIGPSYSSEGYSSGYRYKIYEQIIPCDLIIESDEWFDAYSRAEFAAIGHISLLEKDRDLG